MILSGRHFSLFVLTVCLIVIDAAHVFTAKDAHKSYFVQRPSRMVSKSQLCSRLFPTSLKTPDLIHSLSEPLQQLKSDVYQSVSKSTFLGKVSAHGTTTFCSAVFLNADTIVFAPTCDVARLPTAYVTIEHPITLLSVRIPLQQSGDHSQLSQRDVSAAQNRNSPFAYAKLLRNGPSWVSKVVLSQDPLRKDSGSAIMIIGFKKRMNKWSSRAEIVAGVSKTRPNFLSSDHRGHSFSTSVASTFEECISR